MSKCPKPDKVKKTAKGPAAKMTANPPAQRNENCAASATTTTSATGANTSTAVSPPAQPDVFGFKWEGEWVESKAYVKQKHGTPNGSVVQRLGRCWLCIADHTSANQSGPIAPGTTEENEGNTAAIHWELMAGYLGSTSTGAPAVTPGALGFKYDGVWTEGGVYVKQGDTNQNASVVQMYGRAWLCIQDNIADPENRPLEPNTGDDNEGATGPQFWELLAGSDGISSSLIPEEKGWLDSLVDMKDGVFDWIKNADLTDWLIAGAIAAGVIWAGIKIADMMQGDGEDPNADQQYTGTSGYDYNGGAGGAGVYIAPQLKVVIASLCDYTGIIYDVSAISDTDTCEFTIGNASSVRTILEQLSLAYQFDMVNSGGVLKFIPRHATSIKVITLDDMGFSNSSNPPAPYTATRFQGIDLPRTVNISYFASDMDYNTFTQTSELYTYEAGQSVTLSVPVTLTHERAKQITEISLVNAHLERMNYKFSTTYKFIDVEPGDILSSPMGLIRILRVTETNEGILEFEASDAGDDAALIASTMEVMTPTIAPSTVVSIGKSQGLWLDPTNLNDQDTGVRIYGAIHGYGKAGWPGATIYMSEDGGNSYEQIASTDKESTVGIVEIAAANATYHTWDMTTEIVVTLKTGTLLSKTELAILNGDNRAQIGQELIGFCNAELIGPKTYKLTKLLRGRQGTEQFIGSHTNQELFVLIDSALVRISLADNDRNTTKQFKVVTNGSSLDVVTEDNVKIVSNNLRMWQVYNAKATVQLNGDWVITFDERVRFNNGLSDFTTVIHDEDFGGFGIAVLDLANVTKSTSVVLNPTFTYNVAQQVAEFGAQQNSIRVSIVPMSKKWGGGYPLIINS